MIARTQHRSIGVSCAATIALASLVACGGGRGSMAASGSGDSAFKSLASEIMQDNFKRHPSNATLLGVHTYDDQLEDSRRRRSPPNRRHDSTFRAKLLAVDTSTLSLEKQLDRAAAHPLDGRGDPRRSTPSSRGRRIRDAYSGGVTNAAYVIMKRNYAPAPSGCASLIARERRMPAALAEARKNLVESAEDLHRDRHRADRRQHQLLQERRAGGVQGRDRRGAARGVQADATTASSPRSATTRRSSRTICCRSRTARFAYGADTYAQALAANEMVDLPLDELLRIAEADRQKNEAAFQATAKQIDSDEAGRRRAGVAPDGSSARPTSCSPTTQGTLDALRQFIVDHHIITIPPSDPAHVKETPPFMRSTTSASMDTPGPFEQAKLAGLLQHDAPRSALAEGRAGATSCGSGTTRRSRTCRCTRSIPGHYLQFLYAKSFPARRAQGVRRGDELRGLGALRRADDARRRLPRRRPEVPARAAAGRAAARRSLHRRHQDAHAGHDRGLRRRSCSRRRRISRIRSPCRKRSAAPRRAVRLLHDGQADDSEAARRLQGEEGRGVLAAGLPRRLHQARPAAAAAHSPGNARRVGQPF